MRPSAWKRELEPGRTAEPVSGDPRWAGEPGAPRPTWRGSERGTLERGARVAGSVRADGRWLIRGHQLLP